MENTSVAKGNGKDKGVNLPPAPPIETETKPIRLVSTEESIRNDIARVGRASISASIRAGHSIDLWCETHKGRTTTGKARPGTAEECSKAVNRPTSTISLYHKIYRASVICPDIRLAQTVALAGKLAGVVLDLAKHSVRLNLTVSAG